MGVLWEHQVGGEACLCGAPPFLCISAIVGVVRVFGVCCGKFARRLAIPHASRLLWWYFSHEYYLLVLWQFVSRRGVMHVGVPGPLATTAARIFLVYAPSHPLLGAEVEVIECQPSMSMSSRRGVLACYCSILLCERLTPVSVSVPVVLHILLRLLSAMPCACGSLGVFLVFCPDPNVAAAFVVESASYRVQQVEMSSVRA